MKQNKDEYIRLEKFSQELKDSHEIYIYKDEVIHTMALYPDAPQPQNLLGIIAEKQGDNALAMKHYRAAWALAPNYRPARENISRLTQIQVNHHCYYCENDCKD